MVVFRLLFVLSRTFCGPFGSGEQVSNTDRDLAAPRWFHVARFIALLVVYPIASCVQRGDGRAEAARNDEMRDLVVVCAGANSSCRQLAAMKARRFPFVADDMTMSARKCPADDRLATPAEYQLSSDSTTSSSSSRSSAPFAPGSDNVSVMRSQVFDSVFHSTAPCAPGLS